MTILREKEGEKTALSASTPHLTILHELHTLPTHTLKINNRSRYSSSTASGRQSLIIMSANDYKHLTQAKSGRKMMMSWRVYVENISIPEDI